LLKNFLLRLLFKLRKVFYIPNTVPVEPFNKVNLSIQSYRAFEILLLHKTVNTKFLYQIQIYFVNIPMVTGGDAGTILVMVIEPSGCLQSLNYTFAPTL